MTDKLSKTESELEITISKKVSARILIVEDDTFYRHHLRENVQPLFNSFEIHFADTVEEALDFLSREVVHVVLLDRSLKDPLTGTETNGIDCIPRFLELQPHMEILVLTAHQDVPEVVRAIRLGAHNYLSKDAEPSLILAQVERAVVHAKKNYSETLAKNSIDVGQKGGVIDFVGRSRAIRLLKERLTAVSESDRPVLLLGDPGTGKTTAAKWIHSRREKLAGKMIPFVSINMAAIPAALAESERFGSEKGSFTDSKQMREGLFEQADGGILFLDEIAEATPEIQAKLLKVLEEKTFYRVGGRQLRTSNFKLICATNRNLEEMIENGQFREDLYTRISTFVVPIPSMAERKEDLEDILKSLLPNALKENKIRKFAFEDIPQDFIEHLRNHALRGNVRGIEKVLSQVLVYCPKIKDGTVDLSPWKSALQLSGKSSQSKQKKEFYFNSDFLRSDFPGMERFLKRIQKVLLIQADEKFKSKEEAAKVLKISVASFYRLMREAKMMEAKG